MRAPGEKITILFGLLSIFVGGPFVVKSLNLVGTHYFHSARSIGTEVFCEPETKEAIVRCTQYLAWEMPKQGNQ